MKKCLQTLSLSGFLFSTQVLALPADTIYLNGDIVPMTGAKPNYAEALAVRDGKIVRVGKLRETLKLKGKATRVVDLGGKTLLPGFIDTHGHFVLFGKNLMDADLFGSGDIADVLQRMKAQAKKVPLGAWIVGFGYNARSLKENRAPTIEELDSVAADRPVMVVDSSGHLASGNSALFKATGISAASPNPEGGLFSRKADGKSLAGPMEETALNLVRQQRPAFEGEMASQVITGAASLWAKFGQTTAMECGIGLGNDDTPLVRNAIDKQLLSIDLYLCAKDSATEATLDAAKTVAKDYADASVASPGEAARQAAIVYDAATTPNDGARRLLAMRPDLDRRYINRVRLGGIKFWLDGSIDTAWFTQPYTTNPPGKTGSFSGYQQIPDAVLEAAFEKYWKSGIQINMHMNGDAAAEQALTAIEKVIKKQGMKDHRPVFVHGSYLRPDQIKRMKKVGAIPSFLTSSLVSGGDSVLKLWGTERANHAMAAQTLLKANMPFTLSHDAPVSPKPWILPLVDAAVNRTTTNGTVVGAEERVSAYDALRAVTAMAAYQIKEEHSKGTLEPGKLADLVILNSNPLKVDSRTIRDITVAETIKEGKTVYRDDGSLSTAALPWSLAERDGLTHGSEGSPVNLNATDRATLKNLKSAAMGKHHD